MSDAPNSLIRAYRSHKIEFQPSDLKFHVTGPEFEQLKDSYCTFASFEEARVRIDKLSDDSAKFKAKNIKFQETVIDETGTRITIVGINRTTGDIQGVSGRNVYPNVDWVAKALTRRNQVHLELRELDKSLSELETSISRSYGRIDADEFPRKLDSLSKTLNEKLELAKQKTPAENVIEMKA